MELWIIVGIIFIPIIAQLYISSTYKNYSTIKNKSDISGFEVARKILDKNGLTDMHIVETKGNLTDHYDPKRKVVRLSHSIFDCNTIASVAVAAHECGHAIQDKEGYFFLKFRSFIFPIVKFSSYIAYIVLIIGFIAELMNVVWLGIILVSLGVLFQLITLPVEFNASARAIKELNELGILDNSEIDGTSNMLRAAAFTYVAALLASLLDLLRLILIFTNRD